MSSRAFAVVAGVATVLVGGCALIAGTNGYAIDTSLDDGSTGGHDGGGGDSNGQGPDSPTGDAMMDAGDSSVTEASGDSAADVTTADGSDAGSIFTSLTGTGAWTAYDVHPAVTGDADPYSGGAFDGHYLYFAPMGTTALRLDTTIAGAFASTTAWNSQPITAVGEDGGSTTAQGFAGAVYDGTYVYFVPDQSTGGSLTSLVIRYDPTAAAGFNATSSWEAFDTRVHFGSKAAGFIGGVFDGTYVYFVPNGSGASGTVVRYDTTGVFQDATAWSSVDVSMLSTVGSTGFAGGVFVAPYLYLIPTDTSEVARFDTSGATGAFSASTAWTAYDVSQGGTLPSGFVGGAVVGTDIFLAPNTNLLQSSAPYGTVYEYGTSAAFGTRGSWPSFDTTQLPGTPEGFFGCAYDGRWVYFAPWLSQVSGNPAFSGVLARYDTTGMFGLPGSWQSFDIATVNPNAVGFEGAVFDGTYVYFIPGTNTTFARFLARTVPATPPFAASFY